MQLVVEIPDKLAREPELRCRVEETSETERCVRRDPALSMDEEIDSLERNADTTCQLRLRESIGLEEVLDEELTRMRRKTIRG